MEGKNEPGRPNGDLAYTTEMFTDVLSTDWMTTLRVIQAYKNKTGVEISWNTMDKYLKIAVASKKIDCTQIGNANCYRIPS